MSGPMRRTLTAWVRPGSTRMPSALLLSAVLYVLAAVPNLSLAEPTMTELTHEQIQVRVAERYKAVFGALYLQNPIDRSYVPMPEIPAREFKVTGEKAGAWIVVHDPLVGVMVRASVSKADGLVQFETIDFAVE